MIFDESQARASRQEKQGGPLILGRYELLRKLGEGNSGTVYACRDTLLCNWVVALKVFRTRMLGGADTAQLELEVTALNFLHHLHVAKFYDFIASDGLAGFTMEYLGGGCISDPLVPGGSLSVRDIVSRLIQVCSGLDAIHKSRIIHRDLKPQNILLSESGIVKITDFGIAMAIPDASLPSGRVSGDMKQFTLAMRDCAAKHPKGMCGTLAYMSPEQFGDSTTIDHRADIYSLGVVAYELLTGNVPFADLDFPRLVFEKSRGNIPPLIKLRPNCPEELSLAVMKAMAPIPDDRYQSARALLEDLWEVERVIGQRETALAEGKVRSWRRRARHAEVLRVTFATVVVVFLYFLGITMAYPDWPVAGLLAELKSFAGSSTIHRHGLSFD